MSGAVFLTWGSEVEDDERGGKLHKKHWLIAPAFSLGNLNNSLDSREPRGNGQGPAHPIAGRKDRFPTNHALEFTSSVKALMAIEMCVAAKIPGEAECIPRRPGIFRRKGRSPARHDPKSPMAGLGASRSEFLFPAIASPHAQE